MGSIVPNHAGPGPCPYCGSVTQLIDSIEVYRRSYGLLWVCSLYPSCNAYVGVHSDTLRPLGRLADPNLRKWKKGAHAAFDALWKRKLSNRRVKNPSYPRSRARQGGYAWLAQGLGLSLKDCHIGLFDPSMCESVVRTCFPHLHRREKSVVRSVLGGRLPEEFQ